MRSSTYSLVRSFVSSRLQLTTAVCRETETKGAHSFESGQLCRILHRGEVSCEQGGVDGRTTASSGPSPPPPLLLRFKPFPTTTRILFSIPFPTTTRILCDDIFGSRRVNGSQKYLNHFSQNPAVLLSVMHVNAVHKEKSIATLTHSAPFLFFPYNEIIQKKNTRNKQTKHKNKRA